MDSATGAPGDILVAVKLDEHAPSIVRSASAIAKLSHKPLRLVHIRGDVPPRPLSLPPADRDKGGRVDPQPNSALYAGLQEIAAAHADGAARVTIVEGAYPKTLLAHAAATKAAMVVAGASLRHPGLLKAKLRLTYQLMATSAVPVLVLADAHGPLDIGTRPLRLLIADDLKPISLRAIHGALELLQLTQLSADVLHLHVDGEPADGLLLSGEQDAELWPGLSRKDRLVNDRDEDMKQRLRVRASALRRYVLDHDGQYAVQLWHGSVAREIHRAAQVHAADISVFGRHKFLHSDSMALGHMPFASMLGVETAILIAP